MRLHDSIFSSGFSVDAPGAKSPPVLRASAVFPVDVTADTRSILHFLGYWVLCCGVREVALFITVRDHRGEPVQSRTVGITDSRAHAIDIGTFIGRQDLPFHGSVEVEVFSSQDLGVPDAAVVLEVATPEGSAFVHASGRAYTEVDALNAAAEAAVPEAGFDILPGKEMTGYLRFVTGSVPLNNPDLTIEVTNAEGVTVARTVTVPATGRYQTNQIDLDWISSDFLGGARGSVRVRHGLQGILPRLITGTRSKDALFQTLGHSSADTSARHGPDTLWINPAPDHFRDSTLFVPVLRGFGLTSTLSIHPIAARHDLRLSIRYFDPEGRPVRSPGEEIALTEDATSPLRIPLQPPEAADAVGARIDICGDGAVPSHLSATLSVSTEQTAMPCDISFAAPCPNLTILDQPGALRWAPIPNRGRSLIAIDNASFLRGYDQSAPIEITFRRVADPRRLVRQAMLPANGMIVIDVAADAELMDFLAGDTGWIILDSPNPNINAWYLDVSPAGMVGGDHAF